MQELKITMLGARGVGKTTLLTAMYEQFQKNISQTNLQLIPDEESEVRLQARLSDLKSLLDVFEAKGRVGIKSTEASGDVDTLPSFIFDMGEKGTKPSLKLSFHDYPGKYHETEASKEEQKFINNLLQSSTAVLIAIDAPALMEKNGKFHELINRPQQMTNLFQRSYQDLKYPKLVIFAPVKCEKYLQNENTAKELLKKIQQGYEPLINLFASPKLNSKVASVITPVQTVGSVVFSHLEIDENFYPHFYFRKIKHDAEYCPVDSEQPLRYLLRFLLKLHLQSRSWGIFNFVRDWFKLDVNLKEAVEEFTKGCKTNGQFTVIQGQSLLNI